MHIIVATLGSVLVLLSCLFPPAAAAQNILGSISGIVVDDSTRVPLEYANVGVYRRGDSSLVKGVVSAKKTGTFEILNLPIGDFFLRLTRFGYNVKRTAPFTIDAKNAHRNLGNVAMIAKTVALEDVLVTSHKDLQNNSIDRKVYNVDQDVLSKAGSASELLQNIPSVQVDIDGNVSLRGSTDVMVLINGKNSSMMDRNRAEALQQLDASAIEKIEVITNPSAKFQPDGTSGIINIVLKKNASLGFNGSVTANVGNQGRYNGGVRLNYNPGGFNLFANYNFRHDVRHRSMSIGLRQIDSFGVLTNYQEALASASNPTSHFVTFGFDADVGGGNSFGASANYWHNTFTANDHARNTYQDSNGLQTEGFDRDRYDKEFQQDYGFALFAQHAYPEKDKTLRLDFSFAGHPEQENNQFTNVYWFPPGPSLYNNTSIHPLENRSQLSLDYTDPLDGQSKIEAGYSGQLLHSDYNYLITNFDTSVAALVTDVAKTSRFIFSDLINGVYATYQRSFGLFSAIGGMRVELENSTSNMVSIDSMHTRNAFNFYPTLHLAYKIGDFEEFQLSYTRRVHRPRTEDLNPFPDYRDPRNPIAGNAGLIPEYIHSLECGYQYQNEVITFTPSLYYRYITNRFTRVFTVIDDSTLLMSQTNLSYEQSAGLELVFSANFGDVISSHASVNIFSDQIDATDIGYSANKETTSWYGALSVTAHIWKGTMLQTNMNYTGYQLTPQGDNLPSYFVNVGGRQELLENKLALTLTVFDVFHTLKRRSEVNTPLITRTFVDSRDGGIVFLGLTYNFGTAGKGAKKDQLQFDEGQ